jgi:hypothetical protein
MGHNFGSYHDGDATYAPTCPSTDYNIMSPVQMIDQHPIKFSACSIRQFKAHLLNTNLK